jgi:hypothetical protein
MTVDLLGSHIVPPLLYLPQFRHSLMMPIDVFYIEASVTLMAI